MRHSRSRTPLRPALILALAFVSIASAGAQLPGIAVLPLEAKQITRDEADILTDALANEIYRTGQVRIVERAQLEKILKEQSLQTSGVCSANECAVEIGRILGLDRIIVGTAGKLGSAFVISARIVDVGGGEILGSTSRHSTGRIEDMLGKLVPVVARDLYSPIPESPAAPPPKASAPESPASSGAAPQGPMPPTAIPPAGASGPAAENWRSPKALGWSLRWVPVDFIDYAEYDHTSWSSTISKPLRIIPQLEMDILRDLPFFTHAAWGGAVGIGAPLTGGTPLFSLSALVRKDFAPTPGLLLFLQPRVSLHALSGGVRPGVTGEFGAGLPVRRGFLLESSLAWTASPEVGHYTINTAAPTWRIGMRR